MEFGQPLQDHASVIIIQAALSIHRVITVECHVLEYEVARFFACAVRAAIEREKLVIKRGSGFCVYVRFQTGCSTDNLPRCQLGLIVDWQQQGFDDGQYISVDDNFTVEDVKLFQKVRHVGISEPHLED